MHPVGSTVAGSAKTGGVHQRFQQQRTMPIVAFPIARHVPRTQRENFARQSFDAHPRQDEKSAVIHDPLQVASPLLVAPSDPRVPSLHLPGRRGPEQTCQLPLPIPHPVAQVRAERHATSEIVIPFHLLAPPAALRLAFHQGQFQRLALAGGACDGRRFASKPQIHPPVADPSRPTFAPREVAGSLRPGVAPAVAGTRGSSTLHWAVSTPATRRRCARSPSLREQKTPARVWRINSSSLGAERASAKGQGFGHAMENGAAQSAPGTMSRITARGARNSPTQRVKASLPCCQQVRSTLTRICCVRAPSQVRFPPHTLRAITMPRMARSAALLVASNPGQCRKVNSQSRSCSR